MKQLAPLFALLILLPLALPLNTNAKGKPVIFDTDWWTDVDDVLALRLLLRAEREKQVKLLGICIDAVNPWSAISVERFCLYEGRRNVRIGIDFQATDYNGKPPYQQLLATEGPRGRIERNEDCEDCVSFYRKLLAQSKEKVDIISVGYLNALSRLLNSRGDGISPLTGRELVRRKVRKLWVMGGTYPEGRENNFCRTERSIKAARHVCRDWPTKITFLGYETGIQVKIGGSLKHEQNGKDLAYRALVAHGSSKGRYAWDPMLTEMACRGEKKAGYKLTRGTTEVDERGANTFKAHRKGRHAYVTMKQKAEVFCQQLEQRLHRP